MRIIIISISLVQMANNIVYIRFTCAPSLDDAIIHIAYCVRCELKRKKHSLVMRDIHTRCADRPTTENNRWNRSFHLQSAAPFRIENTAYKHVI